MPVYTYECMDCGHLLERFRMISRRLDSVQCEECGGRDCDIVIQTPAIRVTENVIDRVNKNIKDYEQRKKTGDAL